MNAIEIAIISLFGGFAVVSLLRAISIKLKSKSKGDAGKKKEKPAKAKKAQKEKVKKTKKSKSQKSEEVSKESVESKEANAKPQVQDEKGFKITKKGVARIQQKAIDGRDSRTLAKVEKVFPNGNKGDGEFSSFDDMLEKMKSAGDPDEMDRDTFRKMFMSGIESDFEGSGNTFDEAPMSGDFVSLENRPIGVSKRRLDHFTIDGRHLREPVSRFEDLPNRKPVLNTEVKFTERITGRYQNITMGDISNRLAPSEEQIRKEEEIKIQEQESDEDIFAKIMERRRRELGLEPKGEAGAESKEIVITPETLMIADAIMNPRHKRKINKE